MSETEYIITTAKITDAKPLALLEQSIFRTDHRSVKNLRYLIRHTTVIVAKKKSSEEIVGYGILLGRKNSRKKRIYALAVSPSARNKGLGKILVDSLEHIACSTGSAMLTLEVGDSNRPAVNLYSGKGFKQYGFKFCYYKDGGHALLMHKQLTSVT